MNFSVPEFWVQHQNDKKKWVLQLYSFHMGKILGKSKTFQYWTFQSKTFKSWIFQSQTSQSSGKMNFLVPDFSVLNFTVPDFTVQLKNELFSPRLYSPIGKWTFQSQTLQSNWKTNFSVPDFWVQHQNDKKNWAPLFLIEYNCIISTWGQGFCTDTSVVI